MKISKSELHSETACSAGGGLSSAELLTKRSQKKDKKHDKKKKKSKEKSEKHSSSEKCGQSTSKRSLSSSSSRKQVRKLFVFVTCACNICVRIFIWHEFSRKSVNMTKVTLNSQ